MLGKDEGFTLIEMLLVVAIIGVLTAIAYANFVDQRDRVALAACKANTAALNNSIMLYDFKESQPLSAVRELVPSYLKDVPECPFGEAYILANGQVVFHDH